MSDLDKALEWAESLAAGPATDRAQAAAKVIQSLPNAWVDVEKVREVIRGQLSFYTSGTASHYIAEKITRNLESLLTPKLPTLAGMTPEDVPPNEPWLIEVDGRKAIGTRYQGNSFGLWSVAALDGTLIDHYYDNEVTLIHKLVPEPPALPEGIRLADHEQYGRVITSPKPNRDGVYDLLVPRPNVETGADWDYAHECELTFLGGADNG